MQHMLNNILHLYEQDKSFRRLFAEQPVFCLPHYGLLLEHAEQSLPKKYGRNFLRRSLPSRKTICRNCIPTCGISAICLTTATIRKMPIGAIPAMLLNVPSDG